MKIFPTFQELINHMLIAVIFILSLLIGLWYYMIQMPNVSFQGSASPLNPIEKELLENLKSHITHLAKEPQGRNIFIANTLSPSMFYIIEQFRSYGYQTALQEYEVDGKTFANIEVELLGQDKPEEILLIGAHYDSISGSPGANDNASGVAGTLEIARLFHGQSLSRTLRLVTFVNEEPPFFQTEAMGSLVYANRAAAKNEKIVGMITLETIGYFSEEPGSQQYPPPF